MQTQRMGASLFELLLVLSMFAVFGSLALPALRSAMAVLAVRAARENAFGLFTRARAIALQHGGAEIELSAHSDQLTIRTATGAIAHVQSFAEHNVDLVLDGAIDPIVLRYDAYGLGRMMSRTITFAVREARAGIIISSFGRVRRW